MEWLLWSVMHSGAACLTPPTKPYPNSEKTYQASSVLQLHKSSGVVACLKCHPEGFILL